jgi:hypothetical protein
MVSTTEKTINASNMKASPISPKMKYRVTQAIKRNVTGSLITSNIIPRIFLGFSF